MARRSIGNLPAEVTSFVGRREELAAAKRLLPTTRVLTLLGPGGVGKTRLSRQVGVAVARAFPDGVWLVELADVHDPDLVTVTVAEVLALRDDTAAPLPRLTEFLADKRLLLILDNCEHLIDACARLVGRIVATTSDVRVLATSREVLGVQGEQVMPVAPLPLPDDETADSDAMRLLAERAGAANPSFAATATNRGALAAICRRLDGIPLALELAALRFRLFTPEQILARLDDTMGLLSAGPRLAPQRQQTIEGAIRWSYDLCTPAEQRLWEQLSVFAGGFDIEAAEAVCEVEAGRRTLFDALTGLVDKSVLSLRYDGDVGRYAMLEPIRQFANDRLAERGGEPAARARHLEHYRRLALRGRTAYWSSDDVAWFRELNREHANLRAALQCGLAGAPETALEMAAVLRPFWEHNRFLTEGYRWLTDALAKSGEPSQPRARALSAAASLAALLSDRGSARRLVDECVTLARKLNAPDILAEAMLDSALLAFNDDDTARALELAETATHLAAECGHHAMEMDSLAFAFVCALVLDEARSTVLAERLLAVAVARGPHLLGGLAQWSMGLDRWRHGDQDAATEYLARSIEMFSLFDRCVWLASAFEGLAWTAVARGDFERAARLLGAAEILARSTVRLAHAITGVLGDKMRDEVREALGAKAFQEIFDSGAALSLDEAIDYALGRVSSPARTAPVVSEAAADVLTRREKDVARLVAAGHSNKRIAADLVISVRTAETHVEHILTKLGFTSRTQIAGWVRDHDV
ncbi:ATP-binding protein [Nocardia gipuzkoensis]|uniref:ATP-binding protein n=1 Tax=Nocardia gipuzkoensis TaxID=2749991 RepID=UPI00237D3489|nr:LuxR C-terminal-related transcriptional regulator [Nocardia gipuzkoensis]MDE1674111.1 LuxR C-terminal-related transcriptional regulator [Nocardia gipuzkoensis]